MSPGSAPLLHAGCMKQLQPLDRCHQCTIVGLLAPPPVLQRSRACVPQRVLLQGWLQLPKRRSGQLAAVTAPHSQCKLSRRCDALCAQLQLQLLAILDAQEEWQAECTLCQWVEAYADLHINQPNDMSKGQSICHVVQQQPTDAAPRFVTGQQETH